MKKIIWLSRHTLQAKQIQALTKILGTEIEIININDRTIPLEDVIQYAIDNNIRILAVVLPENMICRLMRIKPDDITVLFSKMQRVNDKFVFEDWYKINSFTFNTRKIKETNPTEKVLWISNTSLQCKQLQQLKNIYGQEVSIECILANSNANHIINRIEKSNVIATNMPLNIFYNLYKEYVTDKQIIIAEYTRKPQEAIITDETIYDIEFIGWLEVIEYNIDCEKL